jgi:precorrin-6Y C5,15-methyltransferase (decarboxylating)
MKYLTIIGAGVDLASITKEGRDAINAAEVVFGAQRLLDFLVYDNYRDKNFFPLYQAREIYKVICNSQATRFAVLVSGDTGFYSAAENIVQVFGGDREAASMPDMEVTFIPGVSSVSVFFARLKLPWQDAAFISGHGKAPDSLVSAVRRNKYTFCLTGNNTQAICALLCDSGFSKLKTYVGINLGSPTESIISSTPAEAVSLPDNTLTVLLFENPEPDARVRAGIPDDEFIRIENIPMTKSEVRAVILSKLSIKPDDICWDVGAGTGSVSVEMALAVWRGKVYAIEQKSDAAALIKKNSVHFNVGNIHVVPGTAPEALAGLPDPDSVFVGGSGGSIEAIITYVLTKNRNAKIVASANTIETVSKILANFPGSLAVQVQISHTKKAGSSNLLIAQNPIFIITIKGGI